jgi:glycosyltransferase involved in cell wall biosynthesis
MPAVLAAATMVLAVDGYALSDGSQFRGIGTYLHHLLGGLADRGDMTVRLLATPAAAVPAGVEVVELRRRAPSRVASLEHDLLLPRDLRRAGADVVHSPAQHPPRRSPAPFVQTLHDVTPLTHPHPVMAADRRRWLRLAPRVRRAAAVVADSRFSADEAIRHLDLDPSRVEVIHLGVDPALFHPAAAPEHHDDRPYVLHVGSWGPHKGYREAVAVISRLADAGLPHRLVFAGRQDEAMLAHVREAVATGSRPERVEIAGYVDDLPALYRGAAVLLVSSRCEGFGLPAVEAMASGTPVVAFANSSLVEVVGDGGTLVPDGDLDALTVAVRRLLDDAGARADESLRAFERSQAFRWDTAVDAYAEVFGTVARS